MSFHLWLIALVPGPAHALDSAPWQAVLDTHVDAASRVDYAAAAADPRLEAYVASLATAPEPEGRDAKLAFWMNAYNALTVDLVADEWPIASIRDLDGGNPWRKRTFTVASRTVTLDDIEHGILRPLEDARIHAGVNCASVGCPPLHRRAFTAANVDAELDQAVVRWAATNAVVADGPDGALRISRIFDWYGEDFSRGTVVDLPGVRGKQEAALVFLLLHLPPALQGRVRGGAVEVEWLPYSWKVNAQDR